VLGVTRQGYYAYLKRGSSKRAEADKQLAEELCALHVSSRGTYGTPRMRAALQQKGICSGKNRIERIMREQGLSVRLRRCYRVTTVADSNNAFALNTLDRDFTATAPDQRWVADITYIETDEGWCYLAVILDLFARAVVGWELDNQLSARLPITALEMAFKHRRPSAGLLHHSDQGSQYTSAEYRDALKNHGARLSMSRRANCWDNAVAESFFATLKVELIYRKKWSTRDELRRAVFEYIEVFYNRARLHSTLDYKSPAQVETEFAVAKAA
jgi:putative transposase